MSFALPRHLHGGKWSQEEEIYAASIMEAFKAGELDTSDCPEGFSLRKYLAKKLMCSPKRVSKKYEGTGYNGKQVYEKKKTDGIPLNPVEKMARQTKLRFLERKFWDALTAMQQLDVRGSPKAKSKSAGLGGFTSAYVAMPPASLEYGRPSDLLCPATSESILLALPAMQQAQGLVSGLGRRKVQSSTCTALGMNLAVSPTRSANDALATLLATERMRQVALAFNLTQPRANLTVSDMHGPLGSSTLGARMAGVLNPEAALAPMAQIDLESRLKRGIESDIELHGKRARLQF